MEEIECWRRFGDTNYEVSNLGNVKKLNTKTFLHKNIHNKRGYHTVFFEYKQQKHKVFRS